MTYHGCPTSNQAAPEGEGLVTGGALTPDGDSFIDAFAHGKRARETLGWVRERIARALGVSVAELRGEEAAA